MILENEGRLEVKIIDFGLCYKIIRDGKHIEEKANQDVRGTYVYMSRRAHQGNTLSRRDDWESLCYVIYALVNGELPWHYESDKNQMLQMKEDFALNQQWAGMPTIFKKYSEIIFKLDFTEQPDPIKLVSILMQMNSSYYDFKWNDFISDKTTHERACNLRRRFGEFECDEQECNKDVGDLMIRPPQVIFVNAEQCLYKGEWLVSE